MADGAAVNTTNTSATRNLGPGDTSTFAWDNEVWIELAHSDNQGSSRRKTTRNGRS